MLCRPLNMKGIKMQSDNQNSSIINMLDQAISYGEDLKIRIQSDSENDLDTLKSERENWVSDNKKRFEKAIPNYNSFQVPMLYSENIIINGDSEDAFVQKYLNEKKSLISGVEYEIARLSAIREKIKNGTWDF